MSKLDKLIAVFEEMDDREALLDHEVWDLFGLVVEALKEQRELLLTLTAERIVNGKRD